MSEAGNFNKKEELYSSGGTKAWWQHWPGSGLDSYLIGYIMVGVCQGAKSRGETRSQTAAGVGPVFLFQITLFWQLSSVPWEPHWFFWWLCPNSLAALVLGFVLAHCHIEDHVYNTQTLGGNEPQQKLRFQMWVNLHAHNRQDQNLMWFIINKALISGCLWKLWAPMNCATWVQATVLFLSLLARDMRGQGKAW